MPKKSDREAFRKKNKDLIDETKLWYTELSFPNYETLQYWWGKQGSTDMPTPREPNDFETATVLTGSPCKYLPTRWVECNVYNRFRIFVHHQ